MAPTNFTDFIGEYNRTAPIKTSPILPRDAENVPLHRNPVFLVPFCLVLAIVVILICLLTYGFLSRRIEKKRRDRVEAEMWAAARRAGIEGGVSNFENEMIYYRGALWHYNFERKEFENLAEPRTPHLLGPREGSGEVVGRVVGGEIGKVWKDFKKLFDRRS